MLHNWKPRIATAVLAGLSAAIPSRAQVELTETENFSTGFEAVEGYVPGYLQSDPVWSIDGGSFPLIGEFGLNGGYALDLDQDAAISVEFTSATSNPVGWIDFYVKPAFGPAENLPVNFPLGQAALTGFVKVGVDGAIYALHGDGLGNGIWIDTGYTVALSGSVAADWLRMTYRLDYTALSWDIYLDSQLKVVDLGFVDGNALPLSAFSIQGIPEGATLFDQFEAGFINPLYDDADNDGIPDAYELAQGMDSSRNDRDADEDFDGLLNIEEYMLGFSAGNSDSDGDGIHDGAEFASGADPLSADAYSLTPVPYAENFEVLALGNIHETEQWQVSGGIAQVAAVSASSGSQSLELIGSGEVSADVRNLFDGTSYTSMWFDLKVKPALFPENGYLTEEDIDSQAAVVFYFTEDNTLVAFDGVLRQFNGYSFDWNESGWQRVTIFQDYSSQNWDIWCNGALVAENLGFANSQPYFNRLKIVHQSESPGYLDDFSASLAKPLELDTDGDGLFDESEDANMNGVVDPGETDPFNSDTDGDGIIDSIEPTFGLDPTVADTIIAKLVEQEPGDFSWETSFDFAEGYVEAALDAQNGWVASSNAVVSSDETAELTHDSASSVYFEHLIGAGGIQRVWLSFKAKLVSGQMPDVTTLGEDASAYWGFINNGTIGVWDSQEQIWQEYPSIADGEEWNDYAVYLDYDAGTWKICQNGVIVADDLSLADTRGLALARFRVQQEVLEEDDIAKTSAVNDIVVSTTEPAGLDFDGDGLPNDWERAHGFNLLDPSDASRDQDEDGLTALQEYDLGTDQLNKDSDGDGLEDGFEISVGFNPLDFSDVSFDTDGDGIPDWWELAYGLNMNDSSDRDLDLDLDTLSNFLEYTIGTNPTSIDTDGDYTHDGYEYFNGLDPLYAGDRLVDTDKDGVGDFKEAADLTDPTSDTSVVKQLIMRLNFEGTLAAETGQAPSSIYAPIEYTEGFNGFGLKTGSRALNSYGAESRVLEYMTQANMALKSGSFSLWFKPDWTSGESFGRVQWLSPFQAGKWYRYNYGSYVGITIHRYTKLLGSLYNSVRTDGNLNQDSFYSPIRWKAGQWHHIVLNYSQENVTLFVNGRKMHQSNVTFALNSLPEVFSIEKVGGVVDEIEVYNFQLSEEEILDRYNVSHDGDSLPDVWEYQYYGNLTDAPDPASNLDNDAFVAFEEAMLGLSPFSSDTDGDGLDDYEELEVYHTDPFLIDTDGDLLTDGDEISIGSNPLFHDSDQDSLDDYLEQFISTEINGVNVIEEIVHYTGVNSINRRGVWFQQGHSMLAASEYATAEYRFTVPEFGIYRLKLRARQDVQEISIEHGSIEDILQVRIFIEGVELAHTSFNLANGYSAEQYFMTPYLEPDYEYDVVIQFSDILNSHPIFTLESFTVQYIKGENSDDNPQLDWEDNILKLSNTALVEESPYLKTDFKSLTNNAGDSVAVPEIRTSVFPCFIQGRSRFRHLPPHVFVYDYNSGSVLNPPPELKLAPSNGWYTQIDYVPGLESMGFMASFEDAYYYTAYIITAEGMNLLSTEAVDFEVPLDSTFLFRIENVAEIEAEDASLVITGLDMTHLDLSDLLGFSVVELGNGSYELQTLVGLKPLVVVSPGRIDITNIDPRTVFKFKLDQPIEYIFEATHGTVTKSVQVTAHGFEFGYESTSLRTLRIEPANFATEQLSPVVIETSPHMIATAVDANRFDLMPTRPYDMQMLARIGESGPVLDHLDIEAFEISSANESYLPILYVFEDGRVKVRGALMAKNLPANLTIRIEIFRAGVTFEDGTTVREISPTDFDETGRYYYPMIKPAGLVGSTCHRTTIYLSGSFYGDVYFE